MEPSDLTVEILKDIRDEVKQTNDRLDAMNTRLDATNERLETGFGDLSRRIVESEVRTSTAIIELAGTVREMTTVLRATHDLRPRVERCEHEIDELKRRMG